jgi:hypothetical protein
MASKRIISKNDVITSNIEKKTLSQPTSTSRKIFD